MTGHRPVGLACECGWAWDGAGRYTTARQLHLSAARADRLQQQLDAILGPPARPMIDHRPIDDWHGGDAA
jgi:hypothetical protein